MLNPLELTGRSRAHVVQRDDLHAALHAQALDAFLALREAAAREGLGLAVFSSFRDFDAQLSIWNRKFRGERPLYARDGTQRVHAQLSPDELLEAILAWSALPGASRHHWGSDLDVYDARAMPAGYRVQLLPHEYAAGGVFGALTGWLDENLERFGFFRPYDRDRGGVLPEPWHISYAPVSAPAALQLTPQVLADVLREADVLGKDLVLERLPDLYRRYVANVAAPPAALA
jgi:LAS superfamily LD-carboxypeptidase LdcB